MVNKSLGKKLLTLESASKKYNINLLEPSKFQFNEEINYNIWKFLFAVMFIYPNLPKRIEKQYYENFFKTFPKVMPYIKIQNKINLINKKQGCMWLLKNYNFSNQNFKTLDEAYIYFYGKNFNDISKSEKILDIISITIIGLSVAVIGLFNY